MTNSEELAKWKKEVKTILKEVKDDTSEHALGPKQSLLRATYTADGNQKPEGIPSNYVIQFAESFGGKSKITYARPSSRLSRNAVAIASKKNENWKWDKTSALGELTTRAEGGCSDFGKSQKGKLREDRQSALKLPDIAAKDKRSIDLRSTETSSAKIFCRMIKAAMEKTNGAT